MPEELTGTETSETSTTGQADATLPAELSRVARERRLARRAHRKITERGYLRAVINRISADDLEKVAKAVVEDAIDGDVKIRAASREWIGKYILGGGNVRPSDVYCPPVIRKSR